jgi:hypothetical protein
MKTSSELLIPRVPERGEELLFFCTGKFVQPKVSLKNMIFLSLNP